MTIRLIDFIKLVTDADRRDLTFNSIAMDRDGNIFDPHDGVRDIQEKRIRFVGDPEKRIREDYLRIMRFFRFLGKSDEMTTDYRNLYAIGNNAGGLENISVERIWSEMKKIVTGENRKTVFDLMKITGVMKVIGIEDYNHRITSRDPAFAMSEMIGRDVLRISSKWKWSTEETKKALFYCDRVNVYSEENAKIDLVNDFDVDWVVELLKIEGIDFKAEKWDIPVFPVRGSDLIAMGMKQGREMGDCLRNMKAKWIAENFQTDRDSLLTMITVTVK